MMMGKAAKNTSLYAFKAEKFDMSAKTRVLLLELPAIPITSIGNLVRLVGRDG
jgi:hypothetical protein